MTKLLEKIPNANVNGSKSREMEGALKIYARYSILQDAVSGSNPLSGVVDNDKTIVGEALTLHCVNRTRQQSLSIRWILIAVRGKAGRPMFLRLGDELMAAYRKEGEAMTKRENTIKMAESNKAFAHFAW